METVNSHRSLLLAAGVLLVSGGCSSTGGSTPGIGSKSVSHASSAVSNAQSSRNVATTLSGASNGRGTYCEDVLLNGQPTLNIGCNLPDPQSSATVTFSNNPFFYRPGQDCSAATLHAALTSADAFGTSIEFTPATFPASPLCGGTGTTTIRVIRASGPFYYGHPGAAYRIYTTYTKHCSDAEPACPSESTFAWLDVEFQADPPTPAPAPSGCGPPIIVMSVRAKAAVANPSSGACPPTRPTDRR